MEMIVYSLANFRHILLNLRLGVDSLLFFFEDMRTRKFENVRLRNEPNAFLFLARAFWL